MGLSHNQFLQSSNENDKEEEQSTAEQSSNHFQDISERKQAEERLSRSEKHFRALIEHIADGIVLTDANGIMTYVSSSVTRLTGLPPEVFIGYRVFGRMVYPADQEAAERLLARVVEEPGKVQVLEYRTRHLDGTFFWIEVVGINLLYELGVEAIVWNFRDVTERKQLTEQVTRAKEQLEAIMHNVADSIIVVDANNNLVYVNDTAARTFGFRSAADMLAISQPVWLQLFSKFVEWDERGRLLPFEERPIVQALHGKKVQAVIQYQSPVSEQKYWILEKSQPIFDVQGQTGTIYGQRVYRYR